MSWFGLASYGGSAIVFAAMTVFLLASHPGGRNATWVTAAAAVSMLWSIAMLLPAAPLVAFVLADAVHMLVWTACVLSWLGPRPAGQQHWSVRARVVGLGAMFGIWAAISALYLSKSGAAASAADAAANGYSFAH